MDRNTDRLDEKVIQPFFVLRVTGVYLRTYQGIKSGKTFRNRFKPYNNPLENGEK
jgi:hypothetical protein